ncbi:PDDEXK family nuclease [Dysgonomonas macrotermitis]|uniref:DUF559 domain-containing protein n=1 Tax=Dysgonomonas macrotermitis TaxID=1346286 RepID=A0A1M4WXL8_9BACT|nr:hypothetical protein [Dysgonomonas macrotermitis]SHE85979.1 hypothetical protein SAMN05444362_102347 [Dysgonomonas macrotermitis]
MNRENTQKPEPTLVAKRLNKELQLLGIRSELEKYDGYKHIDIAIPNKFINIEIDGSHHNLDKEQAKRDILRTYYSMVKGYYTIRIPNSLLKEEHDIKDTARIIKKIIDEKPKTYNKNYIETVINDKRSQGIINIGIGTGIGIIIGITTSILIIL